MNMLKGKTASRDGKLGIALEDGAFLTLPGRHNLPEDGSPVTVGIRPEHAEITDGVLSVTVGSTEMLGSETVLHTELASGQGFTVTTRGISRAKAGDKLSLGAPSSFVHVFNEKGRALEASTDWWSDYVR